MKVTYTDLIEFLDVLDPNDTERTKAGKLLDPRQRAILARFDQKMWERARMVNRWQMENLEAMREVLADIRVVLKAHGADDLQTMEGILPTIERLPEHARLFVGRKLQHIESLRITSGHFEHLNLAEPDLGYAALP